MARSGWLVEIRASGNTWESDGVIYRPNEAFERANKSSMLRIQLADGSYGYATYKNKYNLAPLPMTWYAVDYTFVQKIDTYVQNGEDLRITDHLGNTNTGRFTDVNSKEAVGMEDTFDAMAVFEIIPTL